MGKAPAMNIFRMLTHADSAARQYMRLGNALLTRGELDPVLRELAILRVGHLSNAHYEVHQHERISREPGISEAKMEALRPAADAAALDRKSGVRGKSGAGRGDCGVW